MFDPFLKERTLHFRYAFCQANPLNFFVQTMYQWVNVYFFFVGKTCREGVTNVAHCIVLFRIFCKYQSYVSWYQYKCFFYRMTLKNSEKIYVMGPLKKIPAYRVYLNPFHVNKCLSSTSLFWYILHCKKIVICMHVHMRNSHTTLYMKKYKVGYKIKLALVSKEYV